MPHAKSDFRKYIGLVWFGEMYRMKRQELANKPDTEKKGRIPPGKFAQRGPESSDYKTEDYFQQISAESSPKSLLFILSAPELSLPVNESQKLNMISRLQQTHGNANVQRMIQAKLEIGQPNDKYEQEADRVADEVIRMPGPQVERQSDDEEKEKFTQIKPLSDKIIPSFQKQVGDEEEKIIQPKETPCQPSEVNSEIESRINALKGRGRPLPETVRAFFEPSFGYDFSQVRIHSNPEAARMAQALNAKAFTSGRDVLFGTGQYASGTTSGKKLLAHELAHVVQQRESNGSIMQRQPEAESKRKVAPLLPEEISLARVSISFDLPENTELASNSKYRAETTDFTKVYINVSPTGLSIEFYPELRIDLQYPLGDLALRGLFYDFTTACVSRVNARDIQWYAPINAEDEAKEIISKEFSKLFAGTPAELPAYNPLTDVDPKGTLNVIMNNFQSLPSGEGKISTSDLKYVEISTTILFKSEIRETTEEGGIVISKGGSAELRVVFSGTVKDLVDALNREIVFLKIVSDSITLEYKGEDAAKLKKIRINYGGLVEVLDYEARGPLRKAMGWESFLKFIFVAPVIAGTKGGILIKEPEKVVEALEPKGVEKQINEALTKAATQLVRDNCNAIPDIDICKMLGVSAE